MPIGESVQLVKNIALVLLSSAQRTTATNSADVTDNFGAKSAVVIIDVTSVNAVTPTLTVTIQGKDPTSGKYYTILTSAAISTVSTVVLRVHPALAASANLIAKSIMPQTWRVSVAVGDADACNYSIGAQLV